MTRMSRVVSKHLFDFKPAGKLDEDLAAVIKGAATAPEAKQLKERRDELAAKNDNESNAGYLTLFRGYCMNFGALIQSDPAYDGVSDKIVTTSLAVPTDHDGKFDVPVAVYTPKTIDGKSMRAAYIYAHGGGIVAMTGEHMRKPLSKFAVDNEIVVFNVDYRLAPETKCPNNIKDFYEVIKHVHANAECLGIDAGKICIAGDSGGGYICLGAMVLLAESYESHMIKLAIPGIPMTDDYCFSDPLAMNIEERNVHMMMRKIWKYYVASDWETQKHSPHLFPGKASEELLEKFPPTIILETEFDMFITEASRLAGRLRRAGRLLELVVIPGSSHGGWLFPGMKVCNVFWDTMNTIAREYIHA